MSWALPQPEQAPGTPAPMYLGEPAGPPPKPRRTRAQVVLSCLLVLALAAGGALVAFGRSTAPGSEVTLAARTSTAATSAHVTVTGTVTARGTTIPINGTGEVDFASNSTGMTLSTTVLGHPLAEKAVYVAGTLYVQIPELASHLGGKSWLSIDLSSLGGAATGDGLATGVNPAAWLQLLTQDGGTVTTLGTSTVGGTAVQGYSASISASSIRSQIASANLPSWISSAIAKATFSPVDVKVYVNSANLVRRVTTTAQISVGSSGPVVIHESTTYSNYGTPVSVSAPPSTQVVTFGQIMKSFGASISQGATNLS